ncbi:hypothetical protein GCM10010493_77660 [Streptomyces lavendulae subsp. grasserius]
MSDYGQQFGDGLVGERGDLTLGRQPGPAQFMPAVGIVEVLEEDLAPVPAVAMVEPLPLVSAPAAGPAPEAVLVQDVVAVPKSERGLRWDDS